MNRYLLFSFISIQLILAAKLKIQPGGSSASGGYQNEFGEEIGVPFSGNNAADHYDSQISENVKPAYSIDCAVVPDYGDDAFIALCDAGSDWCLYGFGCDSLDYESCVGESGCEWVGASDGCDTSHCARAQSSSLVSDHETTTCKQFCEAGTSVGGVLDSSRENEFVCIGSYRSVCADYNGTNPEPGYPTFAPTAYDPVDCDTTFMNEEYTCVCWNQNGSQVSYFSGDRDTLAFWIIIACMPVLFFMLAGFMWWKAEQLEDDIEAKAAKNSRK